MVIDASSLIEDYFYGPGGKCRDCENYLGPDGEPDGREVYFCHLLALSEKGRKISAQDCPGCSE